MFELIVRFLCFQELPVDSKSAAMHTKCFAVIGSAGGTGRYLVEHLLAAGHSVRAVSRRPAAADHCAAHNAELASRLTYLNADITEPGAMHQAVAGMDGVVFAASAGGRSYWAAEDVDYKAVKQLALACKAEQTPRLLVLSSILVSEQHRMAPMRLFLNNVMASGLMDCKLRGEDSVRNAAVPSYCIVRPGGMGSPPKLDGPLQQPKGHSQVQVAQGDNLRGRIPRWDLAAVCSEALVSPDTHNTTFEVIQRKPEETVDDMSHFAQVLRGLKADR